MASLTGLGASRAVPEAGSFDPSTTPHERFNLVQFGSKSGSGSSTGMATPASKQLEAGSLEFEFPLARLMRFIP